ncbi:type VII secretion EssA family protein [Shouchella lonarensis]|uniref:Type VII secretion protein EssA n=1 Tax=Shouchella lonarensis TaxID=1464122 RepID=A0A1G6HNZ7_9BACI|nr:type VII secretion EssA family protein [Shouchella lonarensis]SDB95873.1 hypothetical protein SAMN05421737_10498 [Shouchella lonarensis]
MTCKRLLIACSSVSILLMIFSPTSLAEESRTDPAQYREHNVELDANRNFKKAEREEVEITEEVDQLQFTDPRGELYQEVVDAVSLSLEESPFSTTQVVSEMHLFQEVNALSEEVSAENGTATSWFVWALGGMVVALLVFLFGYVIPKWFIPAK